ncbi:MAG: FAD-binding oxidoreductase [Gammaproteobacteria bacterium]
MALLDKLRDIVGDDGIITGTAISERQQGIWTNAPLRARAIVRPASTEQVSAILKLCYEHGNAVVTHGGLTGLVQGAASTPDDIVLSLERMRAIEFLDIEGRTMTVEAGAILQTVQDDAESHGLMFPLDLGARGSCTIGGNAATNAGGNRVIRYGMMRDMVLGLEAVLADGTVVSSMSSMLKDNAGYDLKQLFIGTEGTLGVITRLVLRLRPTWSSQETALIACSNFEQVTELLHHLDKDLGGSLSAYEVMWNKFYELVSNDSGAVKPLADGFSYYVLVEALGADPKADADAFVRVIATANELGLADDAVIAKSSSERAAMWALRDNVEQCLQFGEGFIFDVSLPIVDMEVYVGEVLSELDQLYDEHHSFVFGHVGDGNLHFVITPVDAAGNVRQLVEAAVYEPLRRYRGSVSAEHGIGLEKKDWLKCSRSEVEVNVMRALKQALDPRLILNPGKVFDRRGAGR